ncbi:hypothetical protein GMORB2_0739 [Geosmithia morbida]|uniref:HMG box protein n=1 Tax=Geosmithia morbida TaxID=1094350 RepID=A0A9P4Z3S6_9HYPO|nr:uncharacterized protein GMORB2_0739 [Geosmithia morbida]KAF4127001.1 hypothetical protein GMORB2_0739 [Geosmithia morbida]
MPGYKHGDTPKRAMVRGTISYLESQGLPVNKSAIFRHFELSRSQGYAALSVPVSRRNDPEWEETRGRPSKIGEADQLRMERILWDPAYEAVNLNWGGLAREAGLTTECNARTLHRNMGTMGYRRCLGCARSWTHRKTRERRVEYAERMLEAYPDPGTWRLVRFSGELHFGFGLDGRVRLLPRPGEKYCEACRGGQQQQQQQQQQQDQDQDVMMETPTEDEEGAATTAASTTAAAAVAVASTMTTDHPRDVRRLHCWAAVGYGFKSELIFYDDSTSPNSTGVMSMSDYCDKVLERVVKPWLDPTIPVSGSANGDGGGDGGGGGGGGGQAQMPPPPPSFVLEEDVEAFAHGGASKVNIAQQWKAAHGLRCYFNCLDSPDLSPLDTQTLWPPHKQWTVETLRDWDEDTLRQTARDAWANLDQDRINMWVDFMPQRLRHVVDTDGRMVPW